MLRTEVVRFRDYYKQLSDVSELLDPLNIAILGSVSELGCRNLLEVSRRSRIPFSTIYHRVRAYEKRVGRVAHLVPRFSKLGLACLVVIGKAKPGREEQLTTALKLPNYWWSVNFCEGGFTNYSTHCVPVEHLKTFQRYIKQVSLSAFADRIETIHVGDYTTAGLNFDNYDAEHGTWRFTWDKWSQALPRQKITQRAHDPTDYPNVASKADLIIVKELQKDGRRTFAELAPLLQMTVPGVKYHYDKLAAKGVCENFWVNLFPYPVEVSAVYDIMIDFNNAEKMNRFYSYIPNLFFIINSTKILEKNSLLVRAYVPETQVSNMFRLLSELTRSRAIAAYSSLRLRFETRQSQTISYELFDDRKKSWKFDLPESVAALRKIS